MYCPRCGSYQSDDALFCGVCGQPLRAMGEAVPGARQVLDPVAKPVAYRSEPTQQPQQPAFAPQQPVYAPAPAPQQSAPAPQQPARSPQLPPLPPQPAHSPRSLAVLIGAIVTLVLLFQSWVAMPWVDDAMEVATGQAMSIGSSADASAASGVAKADASTAATLLNTAFRPNELPELARTLGQTSASLKNGLDALEAYSSSMPGAGALGAAIDGIGTAGAVVQALFFAWLVGTIVMAAGLILKLARGRDAVLRAGCALTALASMASIAALFGVNGVIEGNLDQALQNSGIVNIASQLLDTLEKIRPFIAPGFGPVGALVASLATLAMSYLVRE